MHCGWWSFVGGCGGGCDQLVMVVGGGGCWRWAVCAGRGPWSSFVAHSLFRGRCGHLWPFVFMGIIVCGRYGWSLPFAVWVVVVGCRVS